MTDELSTDLADRIAAALSGKYEVTLELGRGGMAVVFLARDLRHDRFVALKVFRPDVASSVGSERFLLEIKTAAALEHPHILTLIDSGVADGLLYYVMPYIEGESLRQKISREKQLGLDDTVRLTGHIASALDYAHRRGVIHRDIKPENILLQEDSALVADFGIALAMGVAGSGRLTETGFALGTPQYMSPEQAAGDRELDSRSDTYALGCLVYEMLTGEPPHTGATAQAVFSKTMTEVPTPIRVIRNSVPEHMEAAVIRALDKVPADRFATPLGFVDALTDPDRSITGPRPLTPASAVQVIRRGFSQPMRTTLGVGLVTALLIIAWYANGRSGRTGVPAPPSMRQVTFSGDARAVSLAPDGEMLAYLADDRRSLLIKDVGGDIELRLVESEEPLGTPRWSPDGSLLLFSGNLGGNRGIYSVSRLGGEPTLVASGSVDGRSSLGATQAYDFAGANDSYAIACCGARVYLGQKPASITRVTRDSFATSEGSLIDLKNSVLRIQALDVSPTGDWIAFVGATADQQVILGAAAADGSTITVLAQEDGIGWGPVAPFGSPQWSSSGEGLFYSQHSGSGSNIFKVLVNPRAGVRIGEPLVVAPSLPAELTFGVAVGQRRLVYAGGANRTQLVMVERGVAGSERLTTGTWIYHSPTIGPDGTLLAYGKGTGEEQDIYIRSFVTNTETRLTQDRQTVGAMSWSPDGTRIAYSVSTGAGAMPRIVELETGLVTDVGTGPTNPGQAPQWAADGESLLLSRAREGLVAFDLNTQTESRVEIPQLRQLLLAAMGLPAGQPEADAEGLHARPEGRRPDSVAARRDRLPRGAGMSQRVRTPVIAPDGKHLAVFLGVGQEQGLWLLPIGAGDARKLVADLAWPLGWLDEEAIMFVRDPFGGAGNTRIEKAFSAGGAAETVMELPFRCDLGNLTVSRDGERAVCALRESTSDVYVIEGLDFRMR